MSEIQMNMISLGGRFNNIPFRLLHGGLRMAYGVEFQGSTRILVIHESLHIQGGWHDWFGCNAEGGQFLVFMMQEDFLMKEQYIVASYSNSVGTGSEYNSITGSSILDLREWPETTITVTHDAEMSETTFLMIDVHDFQKP